MPIINKREKQANPARTLIISLFTVIAIGTILLIFPFSSKGGQWTDIVTCLFTATSATSVTGITLVDTFSHWNMFGQAVIMLMIQIGGLGLITIVTFFNYAIGRKMGLMRATAIADEVSVSGIVGAKRLFIRIIKYTLRIELAGALILGFTFVPDFGAYGVFAAVFIAISAFCNAGFDVLSAGGEGFSLTSYSDRPQVLLVLAALIFLGGIGFVVWDNLASYRRTKKLLMHTKLVLTVSGIMILVGFVFYLIVTLIDTPKYGDMGLGERLLSCLFASFSARTAGFSVADLPTANDFAKLATIMLMFVGAAPGSTAGGTKVTTVALLIATVISVIKGREDASIFKHRIPKKLIYKSLTVTVLSMGFIMISFACIYLLNPELKELDILYEVVSAFTTTGYSAGISGVTNVASKLILCFTMFVGRIGPVSLLLSFAGDKTDGDKNKILPECELLIG